MSLQASQMQIKIDQMVGARLRQARTSRDLSLNEVASRAHISVATLSRIERDKQGLDLGLFLVLCKVLKTLPHDMLGTEEIGDPLAVQIGRLNHGERVQLWRDLADARRVDRHAMPRWQIRRLADEVEELLAQLQYVQAEIETFQTQVRKR